MYYIKKPVIIEAMQFTNDNKEQVYQWVSSIQTNVMPFISDGKPVLVIPTLEGRMMATIGDYIIRGVQDEIYPCKPDIFESTYDAVADDNIPD